MSHETTRAASSAKVSLGDRMRDDKTLENVQIEGVLRGALAALRKLHDSRPVVLHGAITPDAISIDDAGTTTLLRPEETNAAAAYRDGPRAAAGYAPIEQVLGRASPSSDLYSLAMSVVAAGVGREPGALPVDARTAKVDVAKALPNVDAHVRRALLAMLEPVPLRRVDSVSGALAILDRRGGAREWTMVAVGLVAAMALAMLVLVAPWRSGSGADGDPLRVAPAPKETTAHDFWAAYSRVTADLDGDGAREVVAWDHGGTVFAVNGKTGALLWHTTLSSQAFNVGDALIIGASSSGFDVTAVDSRTGSELWQKKLADELYGVDFGDGCVALTLKGNARVTFGNDGTPRPCPDAHAQPSVPYRDRDAPLMVDGLTLLFSDVGAGTSRLGVERVSPGPRLGDGGAAALESFSKSVADARQHRKDAGVSSLWNVTLDVASEQPDERGVMLTPSGLLLTGRDREKHGYHAFLLDPDTGATKKHLSLCDYVSVSMPIIQRISRDLVKIHCEGELDVVDESTLDIKWTAGRSRP